LSYTGSTILRVRGRAQDTHGVSGLSVNGAVATTTDGFANWMATVPIAAGVNTLTVAVTDGWGNNNSNAARVTVANRGESVAVIGALAIDPLRGRLLLADSVTGMLLSVRDGHGTLVSGSRRGNGLVPGLATSLTVDAANHRGYSVDGSRDLIVSIELDAGHRVLVSSYQGDDLVIRDNLVWDVAGGRLVGTNANNGIVAVNVTTGTRSAFSDSTHGSGPLPLNIGGIVYDANGGAPRLMVSDHELLLAVDLATGNRTVLSQSGVRGSGPALFALSQIVIDEANNRALVVNRASANATVGDLFAVDLATGNRTIVLSHALLAGDPKIAYDGDVYVGTRDRAHVERLDMATFQFSRVMDSDVGSGPSVLNHTRIVAESAGNATTIYSVGTAPSGNLVRLDTATGARTLVSATGSVGSGTALLDARSLLLDTRAGALHSAIVFGGGPQLWGALSVDLDNGNRTALPGTYAVGLSNPNLGPLDAPRDRVVVGNHASNGDWYLAWLPLDTMSEMPFSTPGVGSGAPFDGVNALGLDRAGDTQRVIVSDIYRLLAVDAANGNRTVISSAAVGSGPALILVQDLQVDIPNRRALLANSFTKSIQGVDLTTGARAFLSGTDPNTFIVRGNGPEFGGDNGMRLAGPPVSDVAFVLAHSDQVMAVDLVTGDRVIVAR
jgi:hypothetical protein